MRITIQTVKHEEQRYPTCGDWQLGANNDVTILVSETGDWRSNMLVGIHELVEAFLCSANGITTAEVDAFDIEFERRRTQDSLEEPGDHPDAPYHVEHRIADTVERLVAIHAGADWHEHEQKIAALFEEDPCTSQ